MPTCSTDGAPGTHPTVERVELPEDQVLAPSLDRRGDRCHRPAGPRPPRSTTASRRTSSGRWTTTSRRAADIVLLQARPETVWSKKRHDRLGQDRPGLLHRRHPRQPPLRPQGQQPADSATLGPSSSDIPPNRRTTTMADRFPSPFEIETPDGAEGWQGLYTYSVALLRGATRLRGRRLLVPRRGPLARGPHALGRRRVRVRDRVASQYNTRHYLDPAGVRRRLPPPQRLRLPQPRACS